MFLFNHSRSLKFALSGFAIGALCSYGAAKYQYHEMAKELNEYNYFDTALEAQWNLTFLNKLDQGKIQDVIEINKKLLKSKREILAAYPSHATGVQSTFINKVRNDAQKYLSASEPPKK